MFKIKKKITLLATTCCIATMIVGCNNSGITNNETSTNSSKQYYVSGDNISLDTTVEKVPNKVKLIKAKRKEINTIKLKKLLFGKNSSNVKKIDEEYYEDNLKNALYLQRYGGFFYTSKNYDYYDSSIHTDIRDENYNMNKFSTTKELEFMTREEVIKWLKSKLEKIDINLGDIEYNCYSMEHNQLKKYEEHYDMDDNIDKSSYKSKWDKEDDCYYISIRQKVNGIVEYHKFGGELRNYEDSKASIVAIVSKRGFEYIEMTSAFDFDNVDKTVSIKDPQDILDNVSKQYSNIVGEEKYNILSFKLCYFTNIENKDEVIPIYECYMLEKSKIGISRLQLLFNANTGKELSS